MPFLADEKKTLLAVKGIGPTVITRLEQLGFNNLEQLARADAREIVQGAASLLGSSCWKNSPQARAAIEAAIEAATQATSGATLHR
jgi:predicted RecB family nuclease